MELKRDRPATLKVDSKPLCLHTKMCRRQSNCQLNAHEIVAVLFRCLNLIGNGKQGKNEEAFILCLVPPIGNTLISQSVVFSLICKIICTETQCVALNEPRCKWHGVDGFDLLVSMINCD